MTPIEISALAGAILALIFEYFPKLSEWYAGLDPNSKRLIMIGLMVAVVAGVFGLGCINPLKQSWPCDANGVLDAFIALLSAIAANQAVHRILPK